jgi:hypothetical protein
MEGQKQKKKVGDRRGSDGNVRWNSERRGRRPDLTSITP